MVTLKAAVEDTANTFGNEQPFQYVETRGSYYWIDDDRMLLEDKNESPFALSNKGTSGRLYLIVKANWEVRMRINVNNWRYFNSNDFSGDTQQRYNIVVDSPTIATGKWKSSVTATFRGGSMLAVAADGDAGKWTTSGSSFDREATNRNATDANGRAMLLSFSAPFGDYSTTAVKNFYFGTPSGGVECRVDLVWAKQNEGSVNEETGVFEGNTIVPTTGNVTNQDTQGTYIQPSGWSYNILIDRGTDANSREWWVRLRLNNDEQRWYVVVDGNIVEQYSFPDDDEGYRDAVQLGRDVAAARRREAKVTDEDPVTSGDAQLGLGVGVGVLVIGLVAVAIIATRVTR